MQTLAIMWNGRCVGKVHDEMIPQLYTAEAKFQKWEGYVLDEPVKAFSVIELDLACKKIFHKHGLKRPRIVDDEGYEVVMPAFEE